MTAESLRGLAGGGTNSDVKGFWFRSPSSPEPRLVREHLAAVVRSPPFARSQRLQRFLEYIVDCELTGRREDIQEYAIGLDVYDRGDGFDPRSDSIVRVEARRLRDRLADYYAGPGRRQPLRIALPSRGYVPSFEWRPGRSLRNAAIAIAAAIAIGLVAVSYGLYSTTASRLAAAEPNLAAREAFAKGKRAFEQWTGDGARQAEGFFLQAVAQDADYALAHAWLSAAYRQRAIMGDADFRNMLVRSSEAARTAVALDPKLVEAHHMLAVHLTFEPRWREAEAAFRTAIAIDPGDPWSHHAYGATLLATSSARLDDAETELRTAVRLDPGDLANHVALAKVLYFRRRFAEARTMLEETLGIDPHYPDAMRNLGAVLVQTGDLERAVRLYEDAQELAYLPWGDGLLGHALATSGDRQGALDVVGDLESRYATKRLAALAIATVQVGLQHWDAACGSLRRAWTNREMRMRYVDVDPIYEPMRELPCFRHVVREMGLEELAASR